MEKTQKNTVDRIRFLKTILLILFMFFQGMFINGFYGTLLDFTEILNQPIHVVSIGLSLRCAGSCVGCFAGAFIFNYGNRFMSCAIFLTIEGIIAVLITTSGYLIVYYAALFIIGLSTGAVETGLYVIVADLWKEKSKPFIQAIDFVDIISMIVAPLTIQPFLSHDESYDDLDFSEPIVTHDNVSWSDHKAMHPIEGHQSRIWIPFTIIGLMMVSSSVFASLLQCYTKTYKNDDSNNNESAEKQNEKDCIKQENCETTVIALKGTEEKIIRNYEIMTITVCCLIVFFGNAMVLMFSQFWPVFVVFIELKFCKSKGLLMFSALCGVMALSSFASLLIAIKLRPLHMLLMYLSILIFGNMVLLSFCNNSEPFLWIGAILVCSGLGNYFATVFNLLTERVKVTNFIGSLFVFSAYMSTASGFPFLIGRHIHKYPMVLILANLMLISIITLLCIILHQLDLWKKRRLAKHQQEVKVRLQSISDLQAMKDVPLY